MLERTNKELEMEIRELQAKEVGLTLANRRLQELSEAKAKFVSVTTHQLRTPLAAVKWTLDMAAKGQLGPVTDDQKKYLLQGLISVERAISIVNDLLKIDSLAVERSAYNFKPTDIIQLVSNLVLEFTHQASIKKINFIFLKPSQGLPLVEIDADKVRMALENLIDNAVKYTPEGGQIKIVVSDEHLDQVEGAVEISIADSGIGIPASEAEKIFQKFFRASNAVKAEPDGSGLGLFITRDIVEKHNGTIWFKNLASEGLSGTVFALTLPLHQKKV